jgi:hypothetical protein
MSNALDDYNKWMSLGRKRDACRELSFGFDSASRISENERVDLLILKREIISTWGTSGCAVPPPSPQGQGSTPKKHWITGGTKTVCF